MNCEEVHNKCDGVVTETISPDEWESLVFKFKQIWKERFEQGSDECDHKLKCIKTDDMEIKSRVEYPYGFSDERYTIFSIYGGLTHRELQKCIKCNRHSVMQEDPCEY